MRLKILIAAISVVILTSAQGFAQRRLINKLLLNEADTTRSSSFIPLPAIGYAQETGFEFGVVGMYSFYTDREDTLTRTSSIYGLASFTTKKQSNFKLITDIWSPQNRYHYLSEIRYKNFPFNFYGIGDGTHKADEDVITQKLFRITGEVEKKINNAYYGGLNMSFENYRFFDKKAGGIYETGDFIYGRPGGNVLFLGISQILDTRNTNTYTTKGFYLKLNYSYAPDFFGKDNYTGSLFKVDIRNFNALDKKSMLGFNINYQSLNGNNNPFYLLPQLGNDQMMRGYYTGRYRDNILLAGQAEFRYRFIPRLGVAGFLGAGSVYHTGGFNFSDFKPSFGGGLRYFYDIQRGLSIRLDYGMGKKRPGEQRQKGFYVSIGEAF